MTTITIARLEKAINDCRKVQPPVDYVLGPDLRKLATIWGEMIALRQSSLDIDAQSESRRLVLGRWLGAAAAPTVLPCSDATDDVMTSVACAISNNNSGECEACQ